MKRSFAGAVIALLVGMLVFGLAAGANAQEITGGCDAQVNGRPPTELTQDEPLELKRNERVDVSGSTPSAGGGGEGRTNTDVFVVVLGLRVPLESTEGEGNEWGNRVELPSYLKSLTAGIYRVEAEASGQPPFDCTASGYIELRGGPLTVALGVGAVLAGIGAALAFGARGTSSNAPDRGTIARKTGIEDRDARVAPDRMRTMLADLLWLVALVLAFFFAYQEWVDVGESIGFAVAASAAGNRRVWVHGRVVRGFIGGLLLGLGAALILHQLNLWPLDLAQGMVFPLLVAVASAVRAYIGAAFIVTPPAAGVADRELEPVGVTPGAATADAPTTSEPPPDDGERPVTR